MVEYLEMLKMTIREAESATAQSSVRYESGFAMIAALVFLVGWLPVVMVWSFLAYDQHDERLSMAILNIGGFMVPAVLLMAAAVTEVVIVIRRRWNA